MVAEGTLIVCPFAAEAKLLTSLLPNCRQIDNRTWQSKAAVVQTFNGCGEKAVLDYLNTSSDWQNFGKVVLFGAAGALAPEIEPGQVFVCNQLLFDIHKIALEPRVPDNCYESPFVSQQNSATRKKNLNAAYGLPEEQNLDSQDMERKPLAAEIGHKKSFLLLEEIAQITVKKPVLTGVERLELFKQTGAGIVDMESFFFAREVIAVGLTPLIIRFVSDTANQAFKLPFASNVKQGVTGSRQQILNLLNFSA